MGYYAEKGKEYEPFNGKYKIKLLFGDKLSYGEGDLKPFQITYFCKSHEKIYRIRKSEDKFICGEYELDETDIDDIDDIIGIGAGLEITADDLDLMFGDWEEFSKKLKPVSEENIDWLAKEIPELKESMPDLIMEDIFRADSKFSYDKLKQKLDALHRTNPDDVRNALGALLANLTLDKKSQLEDSTKVNGIYAKEIKKGEIWKINNTRGVGHEVQSIRPALVISNDKKNATLGAILCIAIEGHDIEEHNADNQVRIDKNKDIIVKGTEKGLVKEISRLELTQVFTLDRARLLSKRCELTPDKLKEVLEKFKKYYELPDDSVKQEEPAPENEEVADSESVESGEEVTDSENVEGEEPENKEE